MHKILPPSDLAPLFQHGGGPVDRQEAGAWETIKTKLGKEFKVLDFSVNVNPLGPPSSVLRALGRNLASIAAYPDLDCNALRAKLAERHGIRPERVVVGNGSNDLIYALARSLQPRRVAIVEPTYTEYLRASLLLGAEIQHWFPKGDDLQAEPFDPEDADLVWLCNPNNPTGQLWPPDALLSWVEAHPRVSFVVDEAFLPFVNDEAFSLVLEAGRVQNLIVLRSLTKFYAMPGLRLGYAVGSQEKMDRLRAQLGPWSVNALAQAAGSAAVDDHNFALQTHAWLDSERPALISQLAAFSEFIHPLPGRANYVLCKLRGITGARLAMALLKCGIAIRRACNFVGLDDSYVRIAVRTPHENSRLIEVLRHLLLG